MRKSRRLSLLAWFAVLALALAACGGGEGGGEGDGSEGASANLAGFEACADQPNECNAGEVTEGGDYTHTIEKDILNWNPLTVDGNTFDYTQVLNGIYQYTFWNLPDFEVTLNTHLMESAE